MAFPPHLKTTLLSCGCALAGGITAAWLMPVMGFQSRQDGVTSGPALPGKTSAREPASSPLQLRLDALNLAGSPGQQMAAALQFASLSDTDEIRALLDESRRFPAHTAGTLARLTLLKRWLEVDPAAALEYGRRHAEDQLPKLLGSYAAIDPIAAQAWIQALPTSQNKAKAWQELCTVIAAQDPARAWELLALSPLSSAGSDGSYDVRELVRKLTAQDLDGTMARLSTLPAALLTAARDAIAKQLMETDPARGWDWVRQQPNPNPLISLAIGAGLKSNLTRGLAWLESIPAAQRKRLMNEHGYSWSLKDSAAVAAALRNSPDIFAKDQQEMASHFFKLATWQSPEAAREFLPLLSGNELPEALTSFFKNRSRTSSNAETEAWIASLPPGAARTQAETIWKAEQAADLPVDRSTPDSLVAEFRRNSYIIENDPRVAQLSATQVGEILGDQGGNGSYFANTILTSLAQTNPAPAAAWFASVPLDSRNGSKAAEFSATWAQEDPAAAAAWVSSLPAGELAVTTAANVARQYQRYAPAEAQSWLKTLPPGPVQEAARSAMEGK